MSYQRPACLSYQRPLIHSRVCMEYHVHSGYFCQDPTASNKNAAHLSRMIEEEPAPTQSSVH